MTRISVEMRVVEDDEIVASLCESGRELEVSAPLVCKSRSAPIPPKACHYICMYPLTHFNSFIPSRFYFKCHDVPEALVVSEKLYDAIENGRLVVSWLASC
jgi:hypothetical protein